MQVKLLFTFSTNPCVVPRLYLACAGIFSLAAFIQPSERMNEQTKRQADKQLGKESEGKRERVWMKDLYEDCG